MWFNLKRTFFSLNSLLLQCQSAEDSGIWDSVSTGSVFFLKIPLCQYQSAEEIGEWLLVLAAVFFLQNPSVTVSKCRGEWGMGYSHDCIFFFIKIPLRQCHSAEQSGEWDSFPTVLFFSLKSLYDSVKGQRAVGNGIHSRPVLFSL